jgi:hypothetical protein
MHNQLRNYTPKIGQSILKSILKHGVKALWLKRTRYFLDCPNVVSDASAAGRDPQLARAAAFAGVSLDSSAAGKLFPVAWSAR